MSDKVSVTVDGTAFDNWKSVSVRRSLNTLCGSFSMGAADKRDGRDFMLATQKAVTVSVGGVLVLSGYVDVVSITVDDNTHDVQIRGRDKTQDLVDCSVVGSRGNIPPSGMFKKVDLLQLASALCSPFSIKVETEVAIGEKFARFSIQKGETVFEALDRACKLRGVLPTTNGKGALVLTASGTKKSTDSLIFGANVLHADVVYDYQNRFSEYHVHSQRSGDGAAVAALWGGSTEAKGKHEDKGVSRFRPVIMQSETSATNTGCKKRAEVEALMRAAQSHSFSAVVRGWKQTDDTLWTNNQLVKLRAPVLYADAELLISEVEYALDERGQVTNLTLVRPDAFNANTVFKTGKKNSFATANAKALKKEKKVGFP